MVEYIVIFFWFGNFDKKLWASQKYVSIKLSHETSLVYLMERLLIEYSALIRCLTEEEKFNPFTESSEKNFKGL